jgi:hypothetical protein
MKHKTLINLFNFSLHTESNIKIFYYFVPSLLAIENLKNRFMDFTPQVVQLKMHVSEDH